MAQRNLAEATDSTFCSWKVATTSCRNGNDRQENNNNNNNNSRLTTMTAGDGTGGEPPPGGGRDSNRRRHGRNSRRPSNRLPRQTKFEGSCEELKGCIFECDTSTSQADALVKAQEQISIYVGRKKLHGGLVAKAVETLKKPTVATSAPPACYGTDKVI